MNSPRNVVFKNVLTFSFWVKFHQVMIKNVKVDRKSISQIYKSLEIHNYIAEFVHAYELKFDQIRFFFRNNKPYQTITI